MSVKWLKINLYLALIQKSHTELTDDEVEMGYLLCQDDDIQHYLIESSHMGHYDDQE